jgi:long-subunit acyl-CoA synthetase (AMP-forming)
VRVEEELGVLGLATSKSAEDRLTAEELVEIVYDEISSLQNTAADLQAQVSRLKADYKHLKRHREELKRKQKMQRTSIAAQYKGSIEGQQQLLEQLQKAKKQGEVGLMRSLR